MTYSRRAAICEWIRALWRDDTNTEEPMPEEHIPFFLFHQNVPQELAFYGRRVLTGAAVDGLVTERLGSSLQRNYPHA